MSTINEFVRDMPKVELHVHLEGSVRPQTLLALATKHRITLPASTVEGLQAWYRFTDFPHFVDIYKLISSCIRTPEDIEQITREFLIGQADQHIWYSEVTYTPYTHFQQKQIPFNEQLEAINRACTWAREALNVEMRLILDIDRALSADEGMITAEWAARRQADGVIALGLGGAEVGNPPEKFTRPFALAREAGLRSIPHAGETAGAESIWGALRALNAVRIGHGVRCVDDPALVAELKARQIPLEVCPSSNVCLGVASSWAAHPLPALLKAGLYVTLNSDDPPMFDTTLTQEYQMAAQVFGFDIPQLEALVQNAANVTCLPDEGKAALKTRIAVRLAELHAATSANTTAAFVTLVKKGAYEIVQLSPRLILNRWLRNPTYTESAQFIIDLKQVLDQAATKLTIISDLRHGVIKDVTVIDKLAKLTQHPHFGNATAFGSVTSSVYAGVYERLARRKGHDEDTWPTFEKAVQYLEQADPGVTQGIDWAGALK